jgi:hypothetical protein
MSLKPPITVVLANRPRLFRELLHHALKTDPAGFHVIEAADGIPAASALRDAHWLIVDEDMLPTTKELTKSLQGLGVLAVDGRGGRVKLITPAPSQGQRLSDAPTLSQLIQLLSQEEVIVDADGV